jgi:hypothetical protein
MAAVSNIFNLATYCWWDSQVCIMICVYSFHWLQFKKVFGGLTGYLIKILQILYWPWRGEYLGTKTKPTTLQTRVCHIHQHWRVLRHITTFKSNTTSKTHLQKGSPVVMEMQICQASSV